MSERPPPEGGIWPNDVLARDTTLNGYRIVRLLGRGGFGVTYLAEDLLGQFFALKEYFPRQFAVRQGAHVHAASADEAQVFDDCRARFVYEARALVGLGRAGTSQQDIVRVQTFFEANGTAYMVMEYIIGCTLQARLREHPGGMPPSQLRPILRDILAGLALVHNAGLMHRDIKPANILLRDGVRPVLIDFGSSREARSPQTHGFTQIFSGGYAPPEQIMGTRQGPFSDIYAVGAIGYEAIGGTVTDALARQHAAAARAPDPMPPAARVGAGRYDPALLAAIDAALALDPAGRPESASAMTHMLAQAQAATAAPLPAPQTPARSPAPVTRPAAPLPIAAQVAAAPRTARRWVIPAALGGTAAVAVVLWFAFGRAPAPTASAPVAAVVRPAAAPPPATPPPAAPLSPATLPPAMPPPPRPLTALSPAPLPVPPELQALRSAAAELPCALLFLSQGEGGAIAITGYARRDPGFEAFLRQARAGGRIVQVTTEPVDPGLCPPLPALVAPVQRAREQVTLRLALAQDVVAGARFAATLQGTGGGMLQVDLYGTDGVAHHVLRRALPSGQWSIRLQPTAAAAPGQQLLVAIATAGPLDLGQRPPVEPATDYLPVLQRELDRAAQTTATAPRAEFLFFQAAAPP